MKSIALLFLCSFCLTSCIQQPKEAEKEHNSVQELFTLIEEGKYPKTNAILISQNGKRLFESYFNGYTKNKLQDVRSTTKSITALLAGIAIDKGYIKNIDSPLFDYLPQYNENTIDNWDSLKAKISIVDLLTMRTGIGCEQFFGDLGLPDCEEKMFNQDDWIKYGLDQKMVYKPGEKWLYTGTAPTIMGAVISESAGKSIPDFANELLFQPLNITSNFKWAKNPVTGRTFTAGNLKISPKTC